MILYDRQLKIFQSTLLRGSAFVSGFGTRDTGDGRKRSVIMSYMDNNGITYDALIVPDQIHSANVELIANDKERVQIIDMTDGTVSVKSGILMTVVTADCVPIIFADKKNGVIGISHQGWRGALKHMVVRMLHQMQAVGADVKNIKVALGPSINSCCYEIFGDRYYEFMSEFEPYQDKIFIQRGGKVYLSLPQLNFLQLMESGIKKEHIDFFPFCTRCDKARFFSFQRDNKENYGEMFSFIMRK